MKQRRPDSVLQRDTFPPAENVPGAMEHRELVSQILECVSDAVFALDFDGTVLFWNPAAERLYGWTAGEIVGRSVFDLVSETVATERTREALLEMRQRETWTREVDIVRKDGSLFPAEVTLSQLRDSSGHPVGVVGVTTDVTANKRAEGERLEESVRHARRMDTIAEASRSFAEAGHDAQAVVDSLARHMTEHVGDWAVIRLLSDDGIWLNPVAIYHPDSTARDELNMMFLQDPLRVDEGLTGRVATTGEALIIPSINPDRLRERIKPEYRRWMDRHAMYAVLIVPLRKRRQVIGTIALFRGRADVPYTDDDLRFVQNVADRAALALDNAQLFHEAQEAVRLREEFLSIASHEMRTPLTTITGFAYLLNRQIERGEFDPGQVRTMTRSLLGEASRLEKLVGDLLDVTQIQHGRLDIRPELCNLGEIVRDVTERIGGTHNRVITVAAEQNVDGIWDASRIDQVVTNLLTNALKYSSEGSIKISLASEGGDTAILTVSDEGVGIPHGDVEHLFEPFVRGQDAHLSAAGTGLGLFITRQIVERHGGSIEFESTPGTGTTFTVRLPMTGEPSDS